MKLITSESVSCGHPDKVSDQISDAILDYCLKHDQDSHVAVETLCTTNSVTVAGEVTTKAFLNDLVVEDIVKEVVKSIGYEQDGFDWRTVDVTNKIHSQSPDIAYGVNARDGHEQGAGDQGIMFGYAEGTEETEFMPIPIYYAHKMMAHFEGIRVCDAFWKNWLLPDAKCQLTFDFEDEEHPILKAVVLSHQHRAFFDKKKFADFVLEQIPNILPQKYIRGVLKAVGPDDKVDYGDNGTIWVYVNPAGEFVTGGPDGDSGLTGRKLIVDNYGSAAKIGGGAYSGKDPSKVDRSAAYMCRKVAKDMVKAGKCAKCEISVAYAIGVARPVQVMANTFGTGDDKQVTEFINRHYDFRPKQIIDFLNLKYPTGYSERTGWTYLKTARNGHFGNPCFPWEQ